MLSRQGMPCLAPGAAWYTCPVHGPVVVRLLGPVRLATGTGEVGLRGHAARLLAWLALRPGRAWAADDLVERLWPAGPPPTARTALQGHVARLRRALADADGAAIDTVGSAYALRVDPAAVDADRFDALVERARVALAEHRAQDAVADLTAACDLWSGPALADLRDDAGLAVEAAALDTRRTDAEDELARALVAAADVTAAVELLERLVAAEPLREARWGQLMVALHRAGRQTDALRAYQHAPRRCWPRRRASSPGASCGGWSGPSSCRTPAWTVGAPGPPRHSPPRSPGWWAATPSGPRSASGCAPRGWSPCWAPAGWARRPRRSTSPPASRPPCPTGPWWSTWPARPTPVRSPRWCRRRSASARRPTTIRCARPSPPSTARELLVVLDNCEHVVDEAARVAVALLRASAALRVLATSQERLRVAGEAVVTIEPLAVPGEGATAEEIRRSGAGLLLAQRLDALGRPPRSDDDWRAVGAVARGAGGLPLALEVAAAWGRAERLEVVAERLRGDEVLGAEPPVGAGRRGLGMALDAAVNRLGADGRQAYAAASLFPAWFGPGATAAAAGLADGAARDALAAMVDVSLVLVDPDQDARFRLLPPVRRHAGRLLAAEGEPAAAMQGLTGWCLATAAELGAEVIGPHQAEAVRRFTADLATFRMVLRRALDDGRVADAAGLYEGLAFCWASSPAAPEAAHWGAEVLGQADRMAPHDRVRVEVTVMQTADTFDKTAAHLERAELAVVAADAVGDVTTAALARLVVAIGLGWRGDELDRADRLVAEAREATSACGDAFWAAEARACQGLLALRRLDLVTATARLEEALAEHQAVGTPVGQARTLLFLGFARRWMDDLDGARRAFGEAQRLLVRGRVTTWLRATVGLAQTELAAGDLDAAEAAFRAAHTRATDVGDLRAARAALSGLAAAARRRDDGDRASGLLAAAARNALSSDDRADAATAAVNLADVLGERGDHDTAALLMGAASLVPPELGVRLDATPASDAGAVARRLAAAMGDERLDRLRDEGRLLGLEAALARAEG